MFYSFMPLSWDVRLQKLRDFVRGVWCFTVSFLHRPMFAISSRRVLPRVVVLHTFMPLSSNVCLKKSCGFARGRCTLSFMSLSSDVRLQ